MIRLTAEVAALVRDPSPDAIRQSLQYAIELEHATLPPYLYAYWSLGTATAQPDNQPIAQILRSVAIQEMAHLAQASNILNAIGGTPVIGTQQTLPSYPGPLPGGVASELTVTLAPCSVEQVSNVFLAIEEPEDPLSFPVEGLAEVEDAPITIGQFYRQISKNLATLDPSTFVTPPRNQLGESDIGHGIFSVDDLASAQAGIAMIIEQGEGTSQSPVSGDPDDPADEIAHFYRFNQIVEGGLLVRSGNSWVYDRTDHPLDLDQNDVAGVPTSPHAADYPVGSPARKRINAFNSAYVRMLQTLGAGLNGKPGAVGKAIDAMFGLTTLATAMMWPTDGSSPLGPTFEWPDQSSEER